MRNLVFSKLTESFYSLRDLLFSNQLSSWWTLRCWAPSAYLNIGAWEKERHFYHQLDHLRSSKWARTCHSCLKSPILLLRKKPRSRSSVKGSGLPCETSFSRSSLKVLMFWGIFFFPSSKVHDRPSEAEHQVRPWDTLIKILKKIVEFSDHTWL